MVGIQCFTLEIQTTVNGDWFKNTSFILASLTKVRKKMSQSAFILHSIPAYEAHYENIINALYTLCNTVSIMLHIMLYSRVSPLFSIGSMVSGAQLLRTACCSPLQWNNTAVSAVSVVQHEFNAAWETLGFHEKGDIKKGRRGRKKCAVSNPMTERITHPWCNSRD